MIAHAAPALTTRCLRLVAMLAAWRLMSVVQQAAPHLETLPRHTMSTGVQPAQTARLVTMRRRLSRAMAHPRHRRWLTRVQVLTRTLAIVRRPLTLTLTLAPMDLRTHPRLRPLPRYQRHSQRCHPLPHDVEWRR